MIIRLLRHLRSFLHVHLLWLLLITSSAFAQNWKSPHYRDHLLTGKIWDTEKNSWITEKQLNVELLEYDYVLLGETHKNIDHHILQARIINSLVKAGAKPTVVMEMLAVEAWKDRPTTWTNLETLKGQAKIKNDSWEWDLYTPILQSVVQYHLKLKAGNIESKTLHAWLNEVGPYTLEEVLTEYWIAPEDFKQLKRDIIESHCGYVNAEFVQFMARAQLQRDRIMTHALISNKSPVVLIAGAGHVRNNYAIPMQLLNKHQRLSYISVAFTPVHPKLLNPEDYLVDASKAFDVLYFTPSYTNQDPCVQFRKQLQKMRKTNTH